MLRRLSFIRFDSSWLRQDKIPMRGFEVEDQIDGEQLPYIVPGLLYTCSLTIAEAIPAPGQYIIPARIAANLEAFKPGYAIISVKGGWPEWSRDDPDPAFPPREDAWLEYNNLCLELLRAFPGSIFGTGPQIKAIRVLNEPNIEGGNPPYYGCWRMPGETEAHAGERYGRFLAGAYRAIKAEFPRVRVHAGGLFTDYSLSDPAYKIPGLEFAQAAVQAGGIADAWTFHSYHPYYNVFTDGRMRAAFAQTMRIAGQLRAITRRDVWLDETAVINYKDSDPDTPHYRLRQADWANFLNGSGMRYIWYALKNNWRECGVIKAGLDTPAYRLVSGRGFFSG